MDICNCYVKLADNGKHVILVCLYPGVPEAPAGLSQRNCEGKELKSGSVGPLFTIAFAVPEGSDLQRAEHHFQTRCR